MDLACCRRAAESSFAGEHRGLLTANDARTGKPLWHFNTGALITSAPISYGVGGQQFVGIVSGANMFAFGFPICRK